MDIDTPKGAKDFPPEQKIPRQEIISKLIKIFETFGFSPLDTPVLERFDVLSAKYAGGAEILKETFKLKDQGDRDLALRYDLTVPLSRFLAMNPNLRLPFKRYQVGEVFRDGPIKAGRLRQFTQSDVDVVGAKTMLADAECVKIAQAFFKEIDVDVIIEINNRKVLDGVLAGLQVPEDKFIDVILAVDKLKKVDLKEIEKELRQKGIKGKLVDELLRIFSTKGTNAEKVEKLRKIIKTNSGIEGLNEIEQLLSYVDQKSVEFSISLARGLAYYTGTVFEVFLSEKERMKINFTSSLAAGGRYDKMIGLFIGNNKEYPAVGISFGIEPITEVLKQKKQEKETDVKKTVTQVYVIPIKTIKESLKILEQLRNAGINADMDLNERGISKNLDYASALNIPFVIFVGEKELAEKKVKLRDMKTGKEELLTVKDVLSKLK
ncbi:histidine--tRNA ligase [Candidatus Woesearchaeota archaeon]|nr:histidine--tRNA ligase [Candidatus Woesearchaeota archaeon]